jgi:thiamine kinase-like enzyme
VTSALNAFEALALVPGWDPAATEVEELQGGRTNRTFLVVSGGERCVLRLNATSTGAFTFDRKCELSILASAGEAGLAPATVYSDIENGVLMTEYLPDPVWTASDLEATENIEALAELIRRVHALPTSGIKLDLNLSAARYEEYLKRRHGLHAYALRCREVVASVPQSDHLVCCHNDIVAENVIASQPLKLIDWEYAGDNDAFFDLASVIRFHNLPQHVSSSLLDAYTGGADGESQERLAAQERVFDAIQWLWLASIHLNSPKHDNAVRLEELQQRIG